MIVSVITIALGIVGLVWFGMPLISFGIVNIGNATGLTVSFALLIYGIFRKAVNRLIRHWTAYSVGKAVWIMFCAAICVIVLLAMLETALMVQTACNAPKQSNVTVVVLGCKVRDGRPSLMLEERLKAAYRYLSDHREAKCVLSGGQGPDEVISEAQCMYAYLVEMGIEKERLYIEDRSTSTRENLSYALEVIQKNGLEEQVVIVTNEFHCYRAKKVADALGISSKAVPAKTDPRLFPTYYVRELYGILYEWVF